MKKLVMEYIHIQLDLLNWPLNYKWNICIRYFHSTLDTIKIGWLSSVSIINQNGLLQLNCIFALSGLGLYDNNTSNDVIAAASVPFSSTSKNVFCFTSISPKPSALC